MISQDFMSLHVLEEEQTSRFFLRELSLPESERDFVLPQSYGSGESLEFTNLRKSLAFLSQMDEMKVGEEGDFTEDEGTNSSYTERKFKDVMDYHRGKMERLRMAVMS